MTPELGESARRLADLEERARTLATALSGSVKGALPEPPPEPRAKDYYLYGVLGAKNVGKSSLVAGVLGLRHSAEEGRDLGEGTRRPRVYASAALAGRIRELMARAGVEADFAASPGKAAALSRVAFLDLPDIESRFEDHLGAVMKVHREIDGLIVVRTAESSFDEAFLAKLRAFRRPQMDLYVVMNKFDDWVAARGGDEAEARAVCTEHLAQVLRDLELSTEDVYLTDARAADSREGGGYDLERLARDLLEDKSEPELERSRQRQWVFQLRLFTAALRAAADLARGRRRLAGLLERCRAEAGGATGLVAAPLREGLERLLARVLESGERIELAESRLVRQVFFHRVDHLPFARLLAAPLYLLAEAVDGLVGLLPRLGGPRVELPGADPNEAAGVVRAVAESVGGALALDQAALAARYHGVEGPPLPADEAARRIHAVLHSWLRRQEETVRAAVPRPWLVYRLAMVLPVAWFVVLRPLAELWVEAVRTGSLAGGLLLAPKVALHLTSPESVVLTAASLVLVYGAVLAAEYRFALARVHRGEFLDQHRAQWVQEVAREYWRELFEGVVPERFRVLATLLDEAEVQLGEVDRLLAALDPEAVADATRVAPDPGP